MYYFCIHLFPKFNISAVFVGVLLLGGSSFNSVSAQQGDAATMAPADAADRGSVIESLAQPYSQPKRLDPNVARVTFYRPAQGDSAGVSSLRVNEHYYVSLQFGSYSEICLPPGRISLAARMVQTGETPKNYNDATAILPTKAGNDVYFRLTGSGNNRANIAPVRAEVALAELKETRRQAHTVSRVPGTVDCYPSEPSVVKQENITLSADTLFIKGPSDIKGVSSQGRALLDELIGRLQKEYGKQEDVQIQITGHADPLGSPTTNKRLSQARAQTVRAYMVQGGIDAQKITSTGEGATQPVITTCGATATPESMDCNKPNRRVVIGVQVIAR